MDIHQKVLAFLEEFHDAPDFARLGTYFAPQGVYQPLVPTTASFKGREAIIAALQKQYLTYYDCQCEIHASAANGRFVFTERSDHVTLHKGDHKVSSRVCAVFECDDEGLIVSWREYWDTSDIARQMGTDVAHVVSAAG
ncbi:limonene-1,2-epoxide hydrolase family protein [Novosphingobium sp. BL-52-GroH]|uniref:limonene-1,2-epoxide hydrolase family protein n=1 Tax=Novosphingobium sp. BL-52-GroH TaxID=3349877 RepID=UPI00384D9313